MPVFSFRFNAIGFCTMLACCLATALSAAAPDTAPSTLPARAVKRPPSQTHVTTADRRIRDAQSAIAKLPNTADPYVMLSIGFMHKARETADGAYYTRAEAADEKALSIDPKNPGAIRQMSWIYAGQHRFPEARDAARRAIEIMPHDAASYGMLGDALIELGDYDGAEKAVQQMADIRPDVSAYTRVSYLRELFGDTEGALEMMSAAAHSASPREPEYLAWCRAHYGNLLFNCGRLDAAEAEYLVALSVFPDYHYALTGMGRVCAAEELRWGHRLLQSKPANRPDARDGGGSWRFTAVAQSPERGGPTIRARESD